VVSAKIKLIYIELKFIKHFECYNRRSRALGSIFDREAEDKAIRDKTMVAWSALIERWRALSWIIIQQMIHNSVLYLLHRSELWRLAAACGLVGWRNCTWPEVLYWPQYADDPLVPSSGQREFADWMGTRGVHWLWCLLCQVRRKII